MSPKAVAYAYEWEIVLWPGEGHLIYPRRLSSDCGPRVLASVERHELLTSAEARAPLAAAHADAWNDFSPEKKGPPRSSVQPRGKPRGRQGR